jgi:drug/metabolite transporter (DMT)-like permease
MIATVLFAILTQPLAKRIINDPSITNLSLSHPLKTWLVIVVFGLTAQLANHLFYLNGVKKVKSIDAGIIMLLEPIVGAILAAVFLRQPITLSIILGGVLILFANYLVISRASKNE